MDNIGNFLNSLKTKTLKTFIYSKYIILYYLSFYASMLLPVVLESHFICRKDIYGPIFFMTVSLNFKKVGILFVTNKRSDFNWISVFYFRYYNAEK